jgi:hypothetical protein
VKAGELPPVRTTDSKNVVVYHTWKGEQKIIDLHSNVYFRLEALLT